MDLVAYRHSIAAILQLKEDLRKHIEQLPENPNVEKLAGNCFTVKLSEILKHKSNLSPEYYDFKTQYKAVSLRLNNCRNDNVFETLEEIIRSKKVKDSMNLHPDVIKHLKRILFMSVSTNSQERLRLLNGCEVNSLTYEGCVAVKGNEIFRNGELVDTLDTEEKVETIWDEYIEEEGLSDEFY